MKTIGIIIEKTNTEFFAYSEKIPIYTTGKNISELIGKAYEAAQL